jgi:hypothetical protein
MLISSSSGESAGGTTGTKAWSAVELAHLELMQKLWRELRHITRTIILFMPMLAKIAFLRIPQQ